MNDLFTQTVEILEPGTIETMSGDVDPDWANPTVVSVEGCSVQPNRARENVSDTGVTALDLWRVYTRPGVTVTPSISARARWQGNTYDIIGTVGLWTAPDGRDHSEWTMRLYEGA